MPKRSYIIIGAGVGDQDALLDTAGRLDLLQLTRRWRKLRVERTADERDAGHIPRRQPQPFRLHQVREQGNASRITAGPTKLSTRPSATGSPPIPNTIGVVDVARLAASRKAVRRQS